ncbi:O-antigen ligase family protein [Paenarthrobacter aromaticivorans]|uniref:O-antigen ligase family protein n=1 Tax=Paenarthrobacter aromaticivorans TaxID=2849150 RepID=UPI003A813DD2
MTVLGLGLLVLGAISALVCYAYSLHRWPLVGIMSAAVGVVVAWEVPQPPPLLNIAGNNIFLLDAIALACIVVALINYPQLNANLGMAALLIIGLLILTVVSLLRGIQDYGMGAAINEFRLFLYPFACLLWSMSVDWRNAKMSKLLRLSVVWLGWLLVAVAFFHMATYGLGSAGEFVSEASGFEQTTRPLVSGQALVLLICCAVCLWLWRHEQRRGFLVTACIFGAVVILVQQRTVWFVAVAAIGVVFVVGNIRTKRAIMGGAGMASICLLLVLASGVAGDVIGQLQSAAEDSGTYDARVVSWTNLLSESFERGADTVIFGAPMGIGFGRLEGFDRWVTFAPHNWYLTVYLRCGIIGLTAFVGFLVLTLGMALKRRSNMAVVAIFVIMIVYGWSYSWLWYTCILSGWAYCSTRESYQPHADFTNMNSTAMR